MFSFRSILKCLTWLWVPIRINGTFFLLMFALGWICTQLEVMPYYLRERGAKPYELSAPELFLDLYFVCLILTLIPQRIRRWVTVILYVIFYSLAIVDMFCYEQFQSTLTPTMLMLIGETSGQEAQEFLSSYLNFDIFSSGVGYILLLIIIHILWTVFRKRIFKVCQRLQPIFHDSLMIGCRALLGCLVAWLLYLSVVDCRENKWALYQLFSYDNLGDVEHELTKKDHAQLYLPVYRFVFAIYANRLASQQITQLTNASQQIQIDSCSHRVPHIVLMIGESYNKHHSQLYGYDKPTTPRQMAMAEAGSLIPYSDVVAPWNLTSFVFKYVFSMNAVGDTGSWCDAPLFPEVFRQAGYRVGFITNQFLPQAKEAVYDFSGGFFLNHPELSARFFDYRNTRLYPLDDGVLREFDKFSKTPSSYTLTILHLMGSHVNYHSRFPRSQRYFKPQMYNRPELTKKQLQILADYDNSLRYNDSIIAAVTSRLNDKDAVVIYMPDHGETVFDAPPYRYGRSHNAQVDRQLAESEMEIPFWIWGSPVFISRHSDIWQTLLSAKDRPLMTDVLPHLLLSLGGIRTPLYRPDYDVSDSLYNNHRPRILKGVVDYNGL